mgnify:CR=1 FL=1
MKITKRQLQKIIKESLLNEIPEEFKDHPELLGLDDEGTAGVKTAVALPVSFVNWAAESFAPVYAEYISYLDFKKALEEEDYLMLTLAGFGMIPVAGILFRGGKAAVKQVVGLVKAGKLSPDVIKKIANASGGEEYTIDSAQLLIEASRDPAVAKSLKDGFFVKVEIDQPTAGRAKLTSVPGMTGRVTPLVRAGDEVVDSGTSIEDELFSMEIMKDILGDRAVGPVAPSGALARGDDIADAYLDSINTSRGLTSGIRMEKLPSGDKMAEVLYLDGKAVNGLRGDVKLEDLEWMKREIAEIGEILEKNSTAFAHGDLHLGNIWVDGANKRLILYDPSGVHGMFDDAGEALRIAHQSDMKNIQGITKRLDFETMIVSSRAEFNDIEHLIKTIPID